MIATSEPIGRFIVLAHNKKEIITKSSLDKEIEDLIDIIKIRLQTKDIETVSEGILDKVFELKFDLIKWFAKEHFGLKDYLEKINKETANYLQLSAYSDLAKTVAFVLAGYQKIFSAFAERFNLENFGQFLDEIHDDKPTYEMIKFFSLHPSPRVRYLKKWIDASSKFEAGLIVSDLILTGEIKFSQKRIQQELIIFLNETIIRYGAYSIFTGFWQPDENDTSTLTNKMQILVATIELDNKIHYKISKGELFNLINN